MKRIPVICFIYLISISISAKEIKTEKNKISYAMGVLIAESIKQLDLSIDDSVMAEGIRDTLKGKNNVSAEEARQIMESAVKDRDDKVASENLRKGEEFLNRNKKEKNVVTLESGLQYKVIKSGNGLIPAANDIVTVHYEGWTIDENVFDSSYKRSEPAVFNVSQVIPGWQEALQLMNEGAIWMLYIPAELAYGNSRPGNTIGRNSVLIFKVELIRIGQ